MPTTNLLKVISNAVIFQAGWILSVLYGNNAAIPVALICMIVYFGFFRRNSRDIAFLLTVVVIGWFGDALLGFAGLLDYPTNAFYPPFWLVTLWLLFASALTWSLEWVLKHKLAFTIFACIGGTFSYVLGIKLSAVDYGTDATVVITALAVIWTFYGVVIHQLYLWWKNGERL